MWIEAIVMPRENDSRPYRPAPRRDRSAVYKAGCDESLEFRTAVLNYLQAHEGAIQQQIGSAMRIDPSTMVALVDQLEGAGLAKRRPHPQDRRAREVLITPKGRRTLMRARELALIPYTTE